SFPLKYEDVPSSKSFPGQPIEEPINSFYEEGIYVGYRYYNTFNVPSAYEFGYGLSYTTFKYSDLKLSSSTFSSEMEINVKITNTGKVPGKEVVQLYVAAPQTEIEKPVRELKGFAKTNLLQPGESQIVTFNIDAYSLASFWSGLSSWITEKGEYEVQIGASSTDIKLKDKFNVPEKIVVEKVHDVLYPNFMMKELSQKDK
ncbi:MAG: fibronectin type III-like domain-contianing protein, partial [Ignavibacteriae bacterium]|nr:fibronectin type III-like domain-contianing protein [Ignavibacteriota bacterium]